ncbi:hypothetical protein TTHERM_00079240 (macronuclear) [Tetrahymena thermophila SB210]|uniref:Uncharacterized protein n=1 Tax=Tetrahymena thermophila (strain SB210) TaxID=312017 RepID=Q23FU0_TETTS|nr:hypothetical protein TTHERM_00079240 [Tetrahymena thermophila SB210]EAR95520.1 hypothetical protein TTHERM_00079240 [Tetrahymena thermophila SB210]|eukprot:XP_001015765.1 hypothetical protein TTHERM_00079240 [Tetrahymena thermophila SB210]
MNNVNQKRKPQENVETLQISNEVGPLQMVSKKLKKSQRLVIEMKLDKKWIGSSQSIHESITLLQQSQSQEMNNSKIHNFLQTSLSHSDLMMGVSEIAQQCTFLNGVLDQGNNVVKIYMQPNKDFNFEKEYTTPSNIDIKSTQYTDNDPIQYDQQMGTSNYYFNEQDIQVGSMNANDDGI